MVKFVWPSPLPILSFQSKIMALLQYLWREHLLSVPTKAENQQGYLKIDLLTLLNMYIWNRNYKFGRNCNISTFFSFHVDRILGWGITICNLSTIVLMCYQ